MCTDVLNGSSQNWWVYAEHGGTTFFKVSYLLLTYYWVLVIPSSASMLIFPFDLLRYFLISLSIAWCRLSSFLFLLLNNVLFCLYYILGLGRWLTEISEHHEDIVVYLKKSIMNEFQTLQTHFSGIKKNLLAFRYLFPAFLPHSCLSSSFAVTSTCVLTFIFILLFFQNSRKENPLKKKKVGCLAFSELVYHIKAKTKFI